MKRIPFKCRFGHITIGSFGNHQEKPSEIVCEDCKGQEGRELKVFGHAINSSTYLWPMSRYNLRKYDFNKNTNHEMAVRF